MVKINISKAVGLFLCLIPVAANACTLSKNLPGQHVELFFERNSSVLSSADVVKLASWTADMKLEYPVHLWTVIVGVATPDEKNAPALAAERAAAAKKFITEFGLTKAPIEIKSYVDHWPESQSSENESWAVTIQLSPGCPNDCCEN